MDSSIIVGILALFGTLGGSWLGVRQSNKLVNWRIDQLEEKVTEHNRLVERLAVAERDVTSAHRRIDKLETERKKAV